MAYRHTAAAPKPAASNKPLVIAAAIAGVILLAVGTVIVYFGFLQPRLAGRTSLTFEPDSAILGSLKVSQDSLQETAKVLAQRFNFLGYDSLRASFEANSSNQIVAKVPKGLSQEFIDQVKTTGVVEFVDFGAKSMNPGTQVNTDYSYASISVEGTKWHTLMTGGQIKTISVYRPPNGSYQVLFSLSEAGTQILSDFSTQNAGSYLGIVMDKVVITCPQVTMPITNGAGVIDGNFTQQQAEIFAAVIRSGPLPIPLK
jgi:preprotein translocase subunit SecD